MVLSHKDKSFSQDVQIYVKKKAPLILRFSEFWELFGYFSEKVSEMSYRRASTSPGASAPMISKVAQGSAITDLMS